MLKLYWYWSTNPQKIRWALRPTKPLDQTSEHGSDPAREDKSLVGIITGNQPQREGKLKSRSTLTAFTTSQTEALTLVTRRRAIGSFSDEKNRGFR